MGQDFAFIFDIIVIALLAGLTFAGAKKGFAKVVLEMAATVLALFLAVNLSEPVAKQIFVGFVKEPVENFFDENTEKFEEFLNVDFFASEELDFEKVKLNGEYAQNLEPNYAGTNSAVMDLTNMTIDLSETGLEEIDLTFFGIEKDADLTDVSVRTVEFSKDDINKYGIGKLVAAQYIASCSVKSGAAEPLGDMINELSKYLPSEFINGTSGVTVSAIRGMILAMFDTRSSVRTAVLEGIIEPYCIIAIRTVTFIIIFILALVILNIVIKLAGLLNKVPILGKANEFLGGVAGLCEGAAIVLIICIITRFIVSMCSDDVILFNNAAIESTFLFKHIYNMDLISF